MPFSFSSRFSFFDPASATLQKGRVALNHAKEVGITGSLMSGCTFSSQNSNFLWQSNFLCPNSLWQYVVFCAEKKTRVNLNTFLEKILCPNPER